MKKAFITGITGMDGSHLADLLLEKGYEVHGLIRRSSSFNTQRIEHIYQDPHDLNKRLILHYGDMTDHSSLNVLLNTIQPDEIYHLAAMSHVKVSFDIPIYTGQVTGLGTIAILEAMRQYVESSGKEARMYVAATSECFGASPPPQNEDTPFYPRSPYGVAKCYAYWSAVNYREAYGLHISNGILFNHTSPRRGETFVCRKITRAIGRIKYQHQEKLYLGNLDAYRDWGHAKDYVYAMWLMLQQEAPGDYVIATGKAYSVKDFLSEAFSIAGLDWQDYVEIDSLYYRPTEVNYLCGDATKARKILGWEPKYSFHDLVKEMVEHDFHLAHKCG